MSENPAPLSDSVRWLLKPGNDRALHMLTALAKTRMTAAELESSLGIDHPEKLYRGIGYLEDRELITRLGGLRSEGAASSFEASDLGLAAARLAAGLLKLIAVGSQEIARPVSMVSEEGAGDWIVSPIALAGTPPIPVGVGAASLMAPLTLSVGRRPVASSSAADSLIPHRETPPPIRGRVQLTSSVGIAYPTSRGAVSAE
jgi:hypothetical protein